MITLVSKILIFHCFHSILGHCDFDGRLVKIITSDEPPHVKIDKDYLSNTVLIEKHGTYNVTNFVSGILVDLIEQISLECNFKYEIHVDQDPDSYGGVWRSANGSIIPYGMYAHVSHASGEFEIILGNAIVEYEASYVVDFFATILSSRIVIAIRNDLSDQLDTWMVWRIMKPEVWLVIWIISLLPPLILTVHDFMNKKSYIQGFVPKLFATLASNFGGNFLKNQESGVQKVTIFVYHFFHGIIIWIFFRATLTSELSSLKLKKPFHDLESLLSTNYLLMTDSPDNDLSIPFMYSSPGSIESQVAHHNMDPTQSFLPLDKALKHLFERPNRALYFYEFELFHGSSYKFDYCDALIVWTSAQPVHYSMAAKKNLPQFKAMNSVIKKLRETGAIDRLVHKYAPIKEKSCENNKDPEGNRIGYDKLLPAFVMLGSVGIGSVILLTLEYLKLKCMKYSDRV